MKRNRSEFESDGISDVTNVMADDWKRQIGSISDTASGTWVIFVFPDHSIAEAQINIAKLTPSFWNIDEKHVIERKTGCLPCETPNLFDIDTVILDGNESCKYHMLCYHYPLTSYVNIFASRLLIESCKLEHPPRLAQYANDLDEKLRTDMQKDTFVHEHVLKYVPRGPVIIGKCKHIKNSMPEKLDFRLREFLMMKLQFLHPVDMLDKLYQFKTDALSHVASKYEMARYFSYCEPFLSDENRNYNLFFRVYKVIYGNSEFKGYIGERNAVLSSMVALTLLFGIPLEIFKNCKYTFRNRGGNKLITF